MKSLRIDQLWLMAAVLYLTLSLQAGEGVSIMPAGPAGAKSAAANNGQRTSVGFTAPLPARFQVQPLPGHPTFVFTLYGVPAELEPLKQLVRVMRDQSLGNGFDPGPTPRPNAKPIFDYLARVGWPVMCYPGYADIDVNGEVPYRGFLGWPKPQLINRQVWAALDFLPHWLQCQVEISKEAATLMAGKRKLVLKLNNYAAILNDKPIKMKHAPLLRERNWFVCVNQIIPLLGGTARFDKKTGITYLTLPKK